MTDASPAETARGRLPVLEKYELIEEIGHGGMATVYRARDPRLGRDVAVKIIHPHLRESKEVTHRFSVEARAVAKLRHPNIVEVFDVSETAEREQYLVVELLHGRTLRKVLQQRGRMPPEVAAALGIEILSALAHAHEQGIVHRDVKPENVFLEHPALAGSSILPSARGRIHVKLMDFGIAKLLDAQGVTSTGQVLGSPAHMAPEQIEGADVDGRSDVFALGVLLYECMVGHLPFEGANPAQVLRRVLDGTYSPAEPEEPRIGTVFSGILDRALAREREHRFESANAMREALEKELARLGVEDPIKELDAWIADPDAYTIEHEKRMARRLAELGHAARKRKDTLGAAADYNRALAYAPNDAQLLLVVSGMQRSDARARMLRRTLPITVAMIGATGIAYFVTRALKHPHTAPVTIAPTVSAPASTRVITPVVPSATESARPAPSATASARHAATIAHTAVVPATHEVTVSLNLPAGVIVKIDDGVPRSIGQNDKLDLDTTKDHTLVFYCENDLCVPEKHVVGAKDPSVSVNLVYRPAKLTVLGAAEHTYAIVERGEINVVVNKEIDVPPMSGAAFDVTVKDLTTGVAKAVTLQAGKSSSVSFP
jgi:serine/threonine-protein kinase